MPTTTTNFSLYLYNSTTDQAESFLNYRLAQSGPSSDSNMSKIDTALKSHADSITSLGTTRGAILVSAIYVSPNYYEASGITTITGYQTGMSIVLKLDQSSSGTVTLNINSLGVKSLMKINAAGTPINLAGTDLLAGKYYLFTYDGTRWVWDTLAVDQSTIIIDSNGDIAHADTSTQATVTNTGANVIQSVTLDGMGHVTALASAAMTPIDGWIPVSDTWTYASASTFTVAGDQTSKYTVGVKIKLTQTTAKYFYVVSSSYSAPNTTVTITGGSDYTLANAVITSPNYSYAELPTGFPQWFNYAPTFGGFSADPTGGLYRFALTGRMCTVVVVMPNAGTSNATNFTLTGPFTSPSTTGMYWAAPTRYADNGAIATTPGMAIINQNSNVINLYINFAAAGWTNSGVKRAWFTLTYEI